MNEKLQEIRSAGMEQEQKCRLMEQLKEKEVLLIKQQDELNETRVNVIRLKKEIEEIRKERDMLKENNTQSGQKSVQKESTDGGYAEGDTAEVEGHVMEHTVAVSDPSGKMMMAVENIGRRSTGKELSAFFSRIVYRRKLDIVRLVSEKDLDPKQLVQVRSAICKGLTEKQLLILINSSKPAEQMEEIINIAVYENKQKGAC